MKRFKVFIAVFVALCFAVSQPAFAADTEKELSKAVFHTQYTDDKGEIAMREALENLWEVIKPHMAQQGHSQFPAVHIWGFNKKEDAIRAGGPDASFWNRYSGYAVSGSAYMLLSGSEKAKREITAHELMHVAQFALRGSSSSSKCISEGAAVWYSEKAMDRMGYDSFSNTLRNWKRLNSEDRITGVSKEVKEQLIEYGYEPDPLPAFSELSTAQQWEDAFEEYEGVYTLCALAFDLLIEIGGGEDAYFEYMSELRRTDWRTAFNRSFDEDLETFKKRFKVYRENWFKDYRLPREIEYHKLIDKLLSCKDSGLWTRKVCAI